MNRLLHRYLLLTSHFGCGELEVAFYVLEGTVTIYAVRNTARSTAHRLGLRSAARRLGTERDDTEVVRALVDRLDRCGTTVRLAPATECVALALDPRLVPPSSLARTRRALEHRYRRLARSLPGRDLDVCARPCAQAAARRV